MLGNKSKESHIQMHATIERIDKTNKLQSFCMLRVFSRDNHIVFQRKATMGIVQSAGREFHCVYT